VQDVSITGVGITGVGITGVGITEFDKVPDRSLRSLREAAACAVTILNKD
jgi:hypothetical protein